MIVAGDNVVEISQSIFLKGSRFVRINEHNETLSVRSRTGHLSNEFCISIATLHDSPARLKHRATQLLPTIAFFVFVSVSLTIGLVLNSDQSTKISCGMIASLFLFAACFGLIKLRQTSYDLLVFYNRFTNQPVFNLYYEKPNAGVFNDFVSELVDRIKRVQAPIVATQQVSVPAQIEAFARLHEQGLITDDQFDDARRKLLETVTAESKRIGF